MAPKLDFSAATDVPKLTDKVILVTGGTTGLGKQTILSLITKQPAHVYFTGRSQASADQVISEASSISASTPVDFIQCDLTSLTSVSTAAKKLLSTADRLDIAMLNAGVMALPPGVTTEGYEIQFGTNHVGHALLVKLLTPLLESTAHRTGDVRLVWNTSLGYKGAADYLKGGIQFDKLKTSCSDIAPVMGPWIRYGQSKLANLLYARAYAHHHPTITSVSIHPGVADTGLISSLGFFQRMFVYTTTWNTMISTEDCALNQQWAATAAKGNGKREVVSGKYYEPVGVETVPSGAATNDELAEKLWEWTQDELSAYEV
ncbi:hypothetical protein LTR62_008757 [Meristemomyces frigidus]|uniref:Oxidoreductase n=1 Tax=Meristemomyces frigidus TaxID=1508187 RepID=A0AAN7T9L2_9PEZI|nr:hypothetical protein LTR62_008757 [Meristemomyces frigidus]